MPDTGFAPLHFAQATRIDSVGPGFLRIANARLAGPVLVSPWGAEPWGGTEDCATPLTLAGQIDVLILGTGSAISHPPTAFRAAMEAAGIGVEPMTTTAAARTFNLLLGEGRRIALAALPLDAVQP